MAVGVLMISAAYLLGEFVVSYGVHTTPFNAQSITEADGKFEIHGLLPSGFRSTSYTRVALSRPVSALLLQYKGDRTSLYVNGQYIASGEVVLTNRSSLTVAYSKDPEGALDQVDYVVSATELELEPGANVIHLGDLPIAVAIHWDPNLDGLGWHAKLEGELKPDGMAPEVIIPYTLPVFSNIDTDVEEIPLTVREIASSEKPSLSNVECLSGLQQGLGAFYRITIGDTRSTLMRATSKSGTRWKLDLVLELASAEQRDQLVTGERSKCLGWKGLTKTEPNKHRFAAKPIDTIAILK